ncbi:hypothetical protein EJB05_42630, partial [Eragrostis curvula]
MVGVLTSGGSWRKLIIGNVRANKMICMGFAAGSMYWYTNRGKVYSLDASAATFSSSSLPGVEDFSKLMIFSKFAVTTGRDGKARILFLGAGNNLKIFANRKGGRDWVLEKTLQLSAEMLGVSSNQNLFLNRSVPLSAETVGMVRIVASMGQLTISAAAYLDIDTSQLERTAESKEYFPIKLPWPKGLRDTGLFICEPLTRLYQKIPPLTASPPEYHQFDAFLLDGAEPGDISMSNFMIFCLYLPDGIAGIFTSGGSWRKVSIDHVPSMEYFGFAAGSLYYYSYRRTVYTLDQGATEFSSSLLPDADAEDFDQPLFVSKLAATAGHDGKARIFFLDAGDNLKILARKIDSRGGSDWMPEKNIQLSAAMLGVPSYQQRYFIWSPPFCIRQTVDTVRIFVSTGQKDGWSVFRLDIETQQLERTTYPAGYAIKLPWPPSLQACLH